MTAITTLATINPTNKTITFQQSESNETTTVDLQDFAIKHQGEDDQNLWVWLNPEFSSGIDIHIKIDKNALQVIDLADDPSVRHWHLAVPIVDRFLPVQYIVSVRQEESIWVVFTIASNQLLNANQEIAFNVGSSPMILQSEAVPQSFCKS